MKHARPCLIKLVPPAALHRPAESCAADEHSRGVVGAHTQVSRDLRWRGRPELAQGIDESLIAGAHARLDLTVGEQLSGAATVVEYTIQKYFSGGGTEPTAWDLQGSNDGSSWDTLASETRIVWSGANYEVKTFTV